MSCRSSSVIYKGTQNNINQHRKHSHFKIYLPQNQQWTTKMSKIPPKIQVFQKKSFHFFWRDDVSAVFQRFFRHPFSPRNGTSPCWPFPPFARRRSDASPAPLPPRSRPWGHAPSLARRRTSGVSSWRCSGFALKNLKKALKIGETRNINQVPVNLLGWWFFLCNFRFWWWTPMLGCCKFQR